MAINNLRRRLKKLEISVGDEGEAEKRLLAFAERWKVDLNQLEVRDFLQKAIRDGRINQDGGLTIETFVSLYHLRKRCTAGLQ